MTIFDIIKDILFTKKQTCFITVDEEREFAPFLVNRWLSMYSPSVAQISNIINKYLGIFENKKDLYTFFMAIFPKVQNKKISYIKKNKEPKDNKDLETIALLAKNKELSQREIIDYISKLNSLKR
jgi:cytochrome oxidase Cu insertion factor (SCO1/SenC/PrrC family)